MPSENLLKKASSVLTNCETDTTFQTNRQETGYVVLTLVRCDCVSKV